MNQPLLVVLPVNQKDSSLAIRLLEWIKELSGDLRPHSALLLIDRSVDQGSSDVLKRHAQEIFAYATRIECETVEEYPKAATEMFGFAARHVNGAFRLPWLWLEPDCVPLVTMWLHIIGEAYEQCPKRYMGPFVRSNKPEFPAVHLNGVSVYPSDAIIDFKPFLNGEIESQWQSWDMAAHKVIVPRASETILIQQFFGKMGLPPTFINRPKRETDPENATTTALLDPRAVLFHRCKDGSLIEILRSKKNGFRGSAVNEPESEQEAPAVPPKLPKKKEASLEIS